jgi:4-hydroxybenzoyl-CoA reductase subunit alpha
METRAAVSSYTQERRLTIYHGNQSPYYLQALMAGVLGMREGDVRVISPYTGGGFGGKFELDGAIFCSAVLSMKTFRPVKIVYTREEDFIASKRRTPMFYYTRTGVKKDGTFCAREATVSRTACYTGMVQRQSI